jgi:hypothetical protein
MGLAMLNGEPHNHQPVTSITKVFRYEPSGKAIFLVWSCAWVNPYNEFLPACLPVFKMPRKNRHPIIPTNCQIIVPFQPHPQT